MNKFYKKKHCLDCKDLVGCIGCIIKCTADFCTAYLAPIVLLLVRLKVGTIFYLSGLGKFRDMGAALWMFENEFKTHEFIPFLTVTSAAYSAMFFELVCAWCLFLGFATRLAAIPLLIMTGVIEFTYLKFPEHQFWALSLAILITVGPGRLSLDAIIKALWAKRIRH